MNVLAPIFLEPADSFWPTREGQERLGHFLRMLADFSGGGECVVATDRPDALPSELRRNPALRLLSVAAPAPCEGLGKRLPGLDTALAAARAACSPGPWVIVNFRSALLDVATLNSALRQFQEGGSPLLVSVREPEDHPCQLLRPVLRHAQGLFLRMETDPAGRGGAATREFCFNWANAGVHANAHGQLFRPEIHGGFLKFRPVRTQDSAQGGGDQAAWRFESPETARVFVPSRLLPAEGGLLPLAALLAPAGAVPLCAPTLRVHDLQAQPQELQVILCQPLELGGEVTLAATGPQGLLPGQSWTARVAPGEACCRFAAAAPQAAGFLLAVTQYTDSPAHDGWEPLEPDIPLWSYSPVSGACLLGDTGQEVAGRQTFPKVFELDASFFLVTDPACARMEEILLSGGAGYFDLGNRSVIVQTIGDRLRAQAVLQLLRQTEGRHEEAHHGR